MNREYSQKVDYLSLHNAPNCETERAYQDKKGCLALWAAVLEQAIRDYQGLMKAYTDGQHLKRHMESAREWIDSDRTGVASFLWVCDVLDLDPAYTRACVSVSEDGNGRTRETGRG